jgi:hypothetical protein
VQETGSVLYSNAKITQLLQRPHEGIIQLIPNANGRRLLHEEAIEIHPDRLLWIDIKHHVGILAALRIPRSNPHDYSGRLAFGVTLNQTSARRQYMLASYDEMGGIGEPTYLHNPTLQLIFGRSGLLKKAIHLLNNSEFISHIPHSSNTSDGIVGQVGAFTSEKHLSINLSGPLLRLKNLSEHGTIAYTA